MVRTMTIPDITLCPLKKSPIPSISGGMNLIMSKIINQNLHTITKMDTASQTINAWNCRLSR